MSEIEDELHSLIDLVVKEIERIFVDGFHGEAAEYAFLEDAYGVTEEEDVKWQFVLEWFRIYGAGDTELDDDEPDDVELIVFLEDEEAVVAWLREMLAKYRSSARTYVPA